VLNVSLHFYMYLYLLIYTTRRAPSTSQRAVSTRSRLKKKGMPVVCVSPVWVAHLNSIPVVCGSPLCGAVPLWAGPLWVAPPPVFLVST